MDHRKPRPLRQQIGSIRVTDAIWLTPDELRTWEALFEARGDLAQTAQALGCVHKTARNKVSELYCGLDVNQHGHPRTRACVLAFYLLYATMRWARAQNIEWRRGPCLQNSHPTKRYPTMQEALAS